MSTATQAGKTKANAKGTARSASATARSAKSTTRSATKTATRRTRTEARRTEQGVLRHTRRVAGAAQAEVSAVASQPTRPAYFALGLVDRTVAGVQSLPSTLLSTPGSIRGRVVSVAATFGDLAERAQTGYTEVTKDGEALVRAIARQDSTQRAQRMAERARRRGKGAVRDTEKAVEAGTEAATEALAKLG